MQRTQVLIIGGSLVGLSASIFLSSRQISNLVIEKHKNSSAHPRAMGFTERTMEYYRAIGLGDKIPQVEPGVLLRRVNVHSVYGEWRHESEWTPGTSQPSVPLSPCRGAAIAQDKLEPILRQHAHTLGSELKLGFELMSFEEQDDGILAQVKCCDSDFVETIHCQYMIAADGAKSAIRNELGIQRSGVGYLRTIRSVLFQCSELDAILGKGIQQFDIDNEDLQAFLTSYQDGRWVLMFKDNKERSEEELLSAIHKAIGKPYQCTLLTTGEWDMAGLTAERYQQGRIFLAGYAAHQLPPTRGGYGTNTGIDDVYNLAWKLELVLKGISSPNLLLTYEQERLHVGQLRHDQTFEKYLSKPILYSELFSDSAMELGQVMRSSYIVASLDQLPNALAPCLFAGQPDIRAPHVWVKYGNEICSTIDLFSRHYTLLVSSKSWSVSVLETDLPLKVLIKDLDIQFPEDQTFENTFGVSSADWAILIRPDGVIAWRSDTEFEKLEDKRTALFNVIRESAFLK